MSRFRIILADDHVLLRKGLKEILVKNDGMEVVGEAGDGLELLRLMKTVTPDMVILDISMPNLRGIEAIREIRAIHPDVKILILTMHKDEEYLSQSVASGADGYLLKEDADTELFVAIEKIRRGTIYISPRLSDCLVNAWAQARRGDLRPSGGADGLTTREREILKLVAEGKSNKEIADLLAISVRTAECHRCNMMEKLKLKKTADLVKYAIRKGYI
ncbi:MAG: response regulator [bacterium]